MGFGGMALGSMLEGASAPSVGTQGYAIPHFAGKAKRVVHLFMNGGPSQVDTFDPKPALQEQHGKPISLEGLKTERPTGAALTREQVVAAGLAAVAAEGEAALGTASVARRLGIRPPSVYHHFAGNEALRYAVAADWSHQIGQCLLRLHGQAEKTTAQEVNGRIEIADLGHFHHDRGSLHLQRTEAELRQHGSSGAVGRDDLCVSG